jgi:hypothetical protein
MRFLGFPIVLTVAGLVVAGMMGLVGLASGPGPADPPQQISMGFNFGGNRSVLMCWDQPRKDDVTSYDLQVVHWNFGRTRTEVVPNLPAGDCGGAVGAGYTFSEDNLYHLALRACDNGRCSDWTDVTPVNTYWFKIPCDAPDGSNCLFPAGSSDATGVAPPSR